VPSLEEYIKIKEEQSGATRPKKTRSRKNNHIEDPLSDSESHVREVEVESRVPRASSSTSSVSSYEEELVSALDKRVDLGSAEPPRKEYYPYGGPATPPSGRNKKEKGKEKEKEPHREKDREKSAKPKRTRNTYNTASADSPASGSPQTKPAATTPTTPPVSLLDWDIDFPTTPVSSPPPQYPQYPPSLYGTPTATATTLPMSGLGSPLPYSATTSSMYYPSTLTASPSIPSTSLYYPSMVSPSTTTAFSVGSSPSLSTTTFPSTYGSPYVPPAASPLVLSPQPVSTPSSTTTVTYTLSLPNPHLHTSSSIRKLSTLSYWLRCLQCSKQFRLPHPSQLQAKNTIPFCNTSACLLTL